MNTLAAADYARPLPHPVDVRVAPALDGRDRLTVGLRFFLALPHLLLVGAPAAIALPWLLHGDGEGSSFQWSSGGVLGAVAGVCALIAWFAILFSGKYPEGLRSLATLYLRWRVRAVAYVTLLRDEYPPFGDGEYPAELVLHTSDEPRNKLTVGFRLLLAIPQLIAVMLLGMVWFLATALAWFAILVTGTHPEALHSFGVNVLRWTTRVEAYLLLLHDDYPPFSFE